MGKKSTWESEGKPRSSTRRASGARNNSCTQPESNRIEARAGCIDRSMAEQTNKRKPSTHGTGFRSVSPRNILVDPWGFSLSSAILHKQQQRPEPNRPFAEAQGKLFFAPKHHRIRPSRSSPRSNQPRVQPSTEPMAFHNRSTARVDWPP